MKYLIDIGHPAHVHYFKNITLILTRKGHEVLFTCRDKDITIQLLKAYNLNYISFGTPFKSLPGKLFGLIYFTLRFMSVSFKFKPDMILNATFYAAFTAWISGKPHLSLEDTFNMEQVKLYLPFTSCVITGDYNHPGLGKKEIRVSGYHELLYLHSKYFEPDKGIFSELGLGYDEPYVLVRFVSWNASHDINHKGITLSNKIDSVREFSRYARVFITSEAELPAELKDYQISVPPEKIHDVLFFAKLVFGESATMVSEGAMLGTPGIYLDNTGRYYTRDQEERYGLVYNFTESNDDQLLAISLGVELLKSKDLQDEWQMKREKMLSAKIDFTGFMVWFIENWPESFKTTKEDSKFQYRFK